MEILAVWFGAAILTAIAAAARGRSPIGWFLIGLLCSIMGLIAVLVMRPLNRDPSVTISGSYHPDTHRDCPLCAEPIKLAAVKCKHCGSAVGPEKKSKESVAISAGWMIRLPCNDLDYEQKFSKLIELDLPVVLSDDDQIGVGPYVDKADATRIKKMLDEKYQFYGELAVAR